MPKICLKKKDTCRMIDLTRHLPTLESTLSPTPHHESLFVTSLKALILGVLALACIYLVFGFNPH